MPLIEKKRAIDGCTKRVLIDTETNEVVETVGLNESFTSPAEPETGEGEVDDGVDAALADPTHEPTPISPDDANTSEPEPSESGNAA